MMMNTHFLKKTRFKSRFSSYACDCVLDNVLLIRNTPNQDGACKARLFSSICAYAKESEQISFYLSSCNIRNPYNWIGHQSFATFIILIRRSMQTRHWRRRVLWIPRWAVPVEFRGYAFFPVTIFLRDILKSTCRRRETPEERTLKIKLTPE